MRIKAFISSPEFPDEDHTHQARTLHFIIWGMLLIIDTQFFAAFLILPHNWPRWFSILLVVNGMFPLLLLLNRQGRTRLAGLVLVAVLWGLSSGLALTAGGIWAPAIWGYVPAVLVAGLLFGARGGIISAMVSCITALGFVVLEDTGHLPKNSAPPTSLSLWVNITLFLEMIAVFQFLATRSINTALKNARQELVLRRRTEAALSESEQRYREVFECTSDVIYLMDVTADGRFLINRWNPATEKIAGFSSADVADKEIWEVFPRDLAAIIVGDSRACLAQGSPLTINRTVSFKGKEYHFHTNFIPVKNNAGKIWRIVGVAHNITERKEAEDALRRSHEELETRVEERTAELQKVNKELEAFSYSVSHDLRRPLRTMTGFTDLLMEEHANELSGDAKSLLELIKDSAVQMNQLIDALLCLSRVERQTLRIRPVNLGEIARQSMRDLQAEQSGRQVDLRIAEMPECLADPDLLRQAMTNLLSNAIKFTSHESDAIIEVGSKEEDGKTVYYVRDNGAGFDMKYAGKLFGVFQRLHSPDEFSGTGVGLSIVQRVIHRLGGTIWADGAVDQGATFYFTLPPVPNETEIGQHAAQEAG